jgi:ADP-heptose:LPS heptosyltransferase
MTRAEARLRADWPSARRVLVVTPVFGVGNLVLLTGLLVNLRRLCPGARITLALPANPYVRTVIGEALAEEIVFFEPRSPRRALALAWRTLRPRGFDVGLATFFLPWGYASAFLLAAGCRRRVAYAPDRAHGFLNTATCVDRGGHEIDRHLALLEASGRTVERTTRIDVEPAAGAWAAGIAERLAAAGAARLVGMHPGCEAVNRQKRWPAERFGEVARRLLGTADTGVIVVLGPGEAELRPALGLPESPRLYVVDGEDLARVVALVARCDVFCSNDSGLMHVAAALSVPVVAIFGPTPLDKNAPVGRATIVEREGLWCRPCWAGPPLTCHRDRRYCLEEVSVDQVLEALRASLSAAPARARRGAG